MSESSALSGRTILVTRAYRPDDELVRCLEAYGAQVIYCPTIEIAPPLSYQPLDKALEELASYQWVIFTSQNAVAAFFNRLKWQEKTVLALANTKILAVGSATAKALNAQGVEVTLIPTVFRAEGVLAALRDYYGDEEVLASQHFLFPRAARGRDLIVAELTKLGAKVDLVEAYQTVMPKDAQAQLKEILTQTPIDVVTFTSPSTVANLVELLATQNFTEFLTKVVIACIGPISAAAAKEYGLVVTICPTQSNATQLAEAINAHFSS